MNRGHVLQSSSPYVQHMMGGGSPNLWSINNMRPSSQPTSSSFLAPPPPLPPNLFPQFLIPPPPPPPPPSSTRSPPSPWSDAQELPESWSQLLLGGLVGEDKSSSLSNMQMAKKLENWEENLLQQNQTSSGDVVKQEDPINTYANMYATTHHHHHGNNAELFQTTSSLKPPWSQMIPVSSPTSCVTTLSSTSNMLDFSSKNDPRHPPPTHSSECNSTATGGVVKKARVQPTTSTQSTFKVRKEKLGDRITALHQIVSPFGKTDTASVLLEAIGYIRFLHNQIEALSLPYLDSGSGNMRQQHVQGDRNCLFPEDPGQVLLNDGCNKMKGISDKDSDEEAKRDLWSRGLCLVPISCTMQVGSDNGADYWAPAAFNGGFR